MNVTVCMATYNGAKYISEQIESILPQLSSNDELIIVDDCSTDTTVEILKKINDARLRISINDRNRSHVYSFSKAISLASNDIIFMSDQDDIWLEGRVNLMKSALSTSNSLLVSSNSSFVGKNGKEIDFTMDGVKAEDSFKYITNIMDIFAGKTNYYGCAMAFHRKLLDVILPVPAYVESHDLWIAMAANILKSNVHINAHTLQRRVHDANASIIKRPLAAKLWSRAVFCISLLELMRRSVKYRYNNSH